MIKVERTEEPTQLAANKLGWLVALQQADTPKKKRVAEGKYGHPSVKEALVQMFNGKCAYCESKVTHIEYGHIEHFRPKSRVEYITLIFEWENLLLACSVCNGASYKGTKFPLVAEGGPPIDPCVDDPSEHLGFWFDPVAQIASVTHKTIRGLTTLNLFGLNRPLLREHRSKRIRMLAALVQLAGNDPEAQALLEESVQCDAEYAAFARTLIGIAEE